MVTKCPECGDGYQNVGQHWALSDCPYPEISGDQYDVLEGLLMGDGCVYSKPDMRNSIFVCVMTNKEYLDYLDDNVFPVIGNGVKFSRSAADVAEQSAGRLREDTDADNYKDVYRWTTLSHPDLNQLKSWYDPDKRFPEELSMTPRTLKHWYVSDGSIERSGRLRIDLSNERENKDKIESLFGGIGVEIDRWYENERNDGTHRCKISFDARSSEQLFSYMGSPPPGFSYKWPNYRDQQA